MKLAEEEAHLALKYISAVTKYGAQISSTQIIEYVRAPLRKRPTVSSLNTLTLGRQFALQLQRQFADVPVRAGEDIVEYMSRLGWVDSREAAAVRLTPTGDAMPRHLDAPPPEPLADSDSVLSVIIDPEDPVAYVRILDFLASLGNGLLVDPYLDARQLGDLCSSSSVRRVLTSDHQLRQKRDSLARTLGVFNEPPRLRYVNRKELHDRFYITESGDVLIFGSSLNSITKRPGVITPIADEAASTAIREKYAEIWKTGTDIRPTATNGSDVDALPNSNDGTPSE
ncbi:hypothetical protein [Clavibacter michiganensis]|uniref:hypothetical protein n=2 Tax=Clavibacter michiganensis TaxID=28447 RepID=UPI0011C21FE3|nr:hypothetical protein [Clavibacter michiganensis]